MEGSGTSPGMAADGHPGNGPPLVSIVICFFNGVEITSRCIECVRKNTGGATFEIILVDDGSTDPDAGEFTDGPDLRVVRSDGNRGFTRAANLGARHAGGEYLVFLNNDTEVQPGWLLALLDAAGSGPDVAAVGAMLIGPDGLLQEAGGVIWSDATGFNYGRGADPKAPEFRFRREVDYCSAACLLVDRSTFESLGGFDECFAPGFYEDTDLCFTLRSEGRIVLYEPEARVVHLEGATFGTDSQPGISDRHTKSAQYFNRLVFQAKWAEVLLRQYPPGTARGMRGGRIPDRPRVLVADYELEPPDQASGGLRMAWIVRLLHELGCEVTFFPLNRIEHQPYASWLRRAGIEVHCTGGGLEEMAAGRPGFYDLAVLTRPAVSAQLREVVRRHFPDAVVVYDAVDLHFVRDERGLALEPPGERGGKRENELRGTKRLEVDEMRAADIVSTVTEAERDVVQSLVPGCDAVVLPNVHAVRSHPVPSAGERSDLLFIGSYVHAPNVDAVRWFSSAILPLIRGEEAARFIALGASPPPELEALACDEIVIPGFQSDVTGFFDRARLFVAPLRYGAGMKGKIGMAMALGLPVVTTSIGAEGMGIVHGTHALVVDDEQGFADAVLRLYHDDTMWTTLSEQGRRLVTREWSPEAMKRRLADLLSRARSRGALRPHTWGLLDPESPIESSPAETAR